MLNNLGDEGAGFGRGTNAVTILGRNGAETVEVGPEGVAHQRVHLQCGAVDEHTRPIIDEPPRGCGEACGAVVQLLPQFLLEGFDLLADSRLRAVDRFGGGAETARIEYGAEAAEGVESHR